MKLLSLLLFAAASLCAQYTTALAPEFTQQFFDNSGNPCASCKLYTYTAGTTTPLASYTDNTLGTPNANPVILDSSGRANVWLANVSYKLVLKTSADVTLKTVDNVVDVGLILKRDLADATNDALNSAMVGYRPTGGTATTVRAALEGIAVNVRTFGATGDGSTNDTTAFQAAVTAAATSGKGRVLVPIGTYSLNLITIPSSITISCESPNSSILLLRTGNTILYATGVSGITIENCSFTGTGSGAGGGSATSDGLIELVASTDIRIVGNRFFNVASTRCVDLENVQRAWVQRNHFSNVTATAVRLNDPGANKVTSHVWIEHNTMISVGGAGGGSGAIQTFGTAAVGADIRHVFITKNHIEATNVGIGADRIFYGHISGNTIIGNATYGECIAFIGSHNIVDHNLVTNCFSSGIMLSSVGDSFYQVDHNVIDSNIVWDNNNQGISVVWQRDNTTIDDLLIVNNICYNTVAGPDQRWGFQSFADGSAIGGPTPTIIDWSDVRIVNNNWDANSLGPYNFHQGSSQLGSKVRYLALSQNGINNIDVIQIHSVDRTVGTVKVKNTEIGNPNTFWWTMNTDGAGAQTTGINLASNSEPVGHWGYRGDTFDLQLVNPRPDGGTNFYMADQTLLNYPTISAVSQANPAVLTVSAVPAGMVVGSWIYIFGFPASSPTCRLISERPRKVTAIAGLLVTIDYTGVGCTGIGTPGFTTVSLKGGIEGRGWFLPTIAFANLTAAPLPLHVWCNDCNIVSAAPHACTGGGTGAWAFRNAGWKCPF
jgi:hypothetical protein